MFGSRGVSGGEAEGRMGLDDRGEDFAGRYGLDALKVGSVLASSRKTGRGIVLNITTAWSSSGLGLRGWKAESGCYDILGEWIVGRLHLVLVCRKSSQQST